MGQATVVEFLRRYKKTKRYQKKRWLTVKEIHNGIKNTRHGSAISSITTSIKKLRDTNMIYCKEMQLGKTGRMIMHYRV